MYSTPGVVVPRRLQVSHDHSHVASHATPVAQYKDDRVSVTSKPYKYTEVKDSVKSISGSVTMDAKDTGTGSNDDVQYDDG